MKYWLDTEFIERGAGKPIDLISIAVVAEDGREFYAVSTEFKARHASQWVKENVLTKLPDRNVGLESVGSRRFSESQRWMNQARMRLELVKFLTSGDGVIEFWGWCCGYDYVVVSQLIGFNSWPSLWPYYFRDIQQTADERGVYLESQPGGNHDALHDARWIRHLWQTLHPVPPTGDYTEGGGDGS